jgi:hypothetical protein
MASTPLLKEDLNDTLPETRQMYVTRKMAFKITLVLASSRSQNSVKVIVKFIWKGLHFQQIENRLSLE